MTIASKTLKANSKYLILLLFFPIKLHKGLAIIHNKGVIEEIIPILLSLNPLDAKNI